jgi:hypothetical protein
MVTGRKVYLIIHIFPEYVNERPRSLAALARGYCIGSGAGFRRARPLGRATTRDIFKTSRRAGLKTVPYVDSTIFYLLTRQAAVGARALAPVRSG